jgi:RNA polymerase sigma factor (sigma-70 family)
VIVGSRAEDVTQDAFSKALLALRRDGAEIELRPWLFRIVRNTALNDLRDSPPSAEALAEVIASGASPAEELERREELADLIRRLQSLPEAQRAAIVMRELEGLSHEEIAGALGLSDGGARQAIYRARRSLRDGTGMLLPLPLLKALLAGAAGVPVEAGAGATGIGGVAGAGVALKAAAATVLVAGAVGAGVAVDHNHHQHPPGVSRPVRGVVADDVVTAQEASTGGGPNPTDEHRSLRDSGKRGETKPGDDHGGHGHRGNESGKPAKDHGGSGGGETDGGSRGSRSGEGGSGHDGSGDGHGGGPGPSGLDGSDGSSGHGSGHGSGGSSGSSSGSSGSGGSSEQAGPSSGGDGSGSSSGPGSGSSGDSPGSTTGSGSGSGSGSGPGDGSGSGSSGSGSGVESGDGEPNFDDSGDSHGGDGLSVQMQPQTQEEP